MFKRILAIITAALFTTIIALTKTDDTDAMVIQKYNIEEPHFIVEAVSELPTITDLSVVEEHKEYVIDVTESDIDLLARVVMSEASILSIDAKQAVASTVINRVKSDYFPSTIYEVVFQDSQFSTADNGDPDEECYAAVYAALKNECFPADMFYFRSGQYHSFGTPYIQIDGMYFSRY